MYTGFISSLLLLPAGGFLRLQLRKTLGERHEVLLETDDLGGGEEAPHHHQANYPGCEAGRHVMWGATNSHK